MELPLTDYLGARVKADKQVEHEGLNTVSGELNLDYRMGEHWTLSSGVRHDSREDDAAVVPATQEEGDRTDAVVNLLYDSGGRWKTYAFAQETIRTTGNREDFYPSDLDGEYQVRMRWPSNPLGGGSYYWSLFFAPLGVAIAYETPALYHVQVHRACPFRSVSFPGEEWAAHRKSVLEPEAEFELTEIRAGAEQEAQEPR